MKQKWYQSLLAILILMLINSASFGQGAKLSVLGTYKSGVFDEGAAEIVVYYDNRLYVINAFANSIDVLDISNPSSPSKIKTINFDAYGAGVNSVAVYNGLIAAAVEADPKQNPGKVVFMDTTGTVQGSVTVGALPDMVTFNEDGTKLLVANEGEPSADYTWDPQGTVSIIDLSSGVASATVDSVTFTDFNFGESRRGEIDTTKVRVFGPGASVAEDLEPEYITVRGDSAWVTLQENNAVALIRISTGNIVWLKSLGAKDHSLSGNGLDVSDRDVDGSSGSGGKINITTWPIYGLYMPDAIASFTMAGTPYLVTANEGDARDYDGYAEEKRGGSMNVDLTNYPSWETLNNNDSLGRLNFTLASGDNNGDGLYDSLFTFGARSFSIWNGTTGALVYDSGEELEQITAAQFPSYFNASNTDNSLDSRSDNKGPEPEGVAIGHIGDSVYAFIGLERVGGIMVYNVTDPANSYFVDYLNNRDFTVSTSEENVNAVGDLGPEGLTFIPASKSPNGRNLLVVGNEISGTTTIYQVGGTVASTTTTIIAGTATYPINQAAVSSVAYYGVDGGGGTLTVNQVDGSPENVAFDGSVTDTPDFVSNYRWILEVNFTFDSAYVTFDTEELLAAGITDLNNVRVFQRTTPGSGNFIESEVVSVVGNLLTVKVVGFSEFVFGSDTEALPVEFSSFTGVATESAVLLKWSTATESSNYGFFVETSSDKATFKTLGFVKGFGTTTEPQSYSFVVNETINTTRYYRLKQVDLDGSFAYSSMVEVTATRPVELALSQNYPNPFNPATTIDFSIPVTGLVKLSIYNALGQEVMVLQNGQMEAGYHSATFNAANIPSGVYFYRLEANNQSIIKQMVLLK